VQAGRQADRQTDRQTDTLDPNERCAHFQLCVSTNRATVMKPKTCHFLFWLTSPIHVTQCRILSQVVADRASWHLLSYIFIRAAFIVKI